MLPCLVRLTSSLGLVVSIFAGGPALYAQAFTPYSDFQQLTISQMSTVQLKLTYVGPQKDVIPSVGLFAGGGFSVGIFAPFLRSGFSYDNDNAVLHTVSVSSVEMKAIIDGVATLPSVTVGLVAVPELISFSLSNSVPVAKVFEAILDKAQAASVFDKLRTALIANKTALHEVSGIACPLVILESGSPVDVSAAMQITLSGFRLNRATGRFVGTYTAKNIGPSPITGPITVVFEFPGAIRMFNLDGTTCGITPAGREFVNLTLIGNTLAAGASVMGPVELVNPNVEPIKSATKVLAGIGAR